MKKMFFSILSLVLWMCGYSQNIPNQQIANVNKTIINNITFFKMEHPQINSEDLFTVTEYYDLGTYEMPNSVSGKEVFIFRVGITKSLDSGEKIAFLQIRTELKTMMIKVLEEQWHFIGYDEIDRCISALTYMKDNMVLNSDAPATDYYYETKSGERIIVSSEMKKGWLLHLADSLVKVKNEDIDYLISLFNKAKALMAEKISQL